MIFNHKVVAIDKPTKIDIHSRCGGSVSTAINHTYALTIDADSLKLIKEKKRLKTI